ncbi:MAG: hypothetical protein F6K54_10095 [Okeania sp. SIO3B5]|uniref:hypothetical protein n=1 Tax=Okeania sp. SIO3B5 TaxID=2607811 RepID=UPI0013FF136F|nr:hypothetical protein [Okeania sp. SIO3B5]NEO53403.1 hypothetical protein [Okeania sp. SIO3B5]
MAIFELVYWQFGNSVNWERSPNRAQKSSVYPCHNQCLALTLDRQPSSQTKTGLISCPVEQL